MKRRLPVTRGDCLGSERPCPHNRCRYAIAPVPGEVLRRTWGCALDYADFAHTYGQMTARTIAWHLGISKARVEQIIVEARTKLYIRVHGEVPPWVPA